MVLFLADDMGLGKTLTMIALILKSSEMKADEEESGDSDDSNLYPKHNSKYSFSVFNNLF